ncbi:hypothetical protein [Streptomyces sp. NBC_01565]|uniref:hypothetical protein n=1 Tax=unclassified Streptomyces TaxID=2593676 RepID=UPI0022528EFF|nr:hypothetical protein [Streptomyces sp. NBC_01565]MCX4546791.1 hypothetical protein [Streptomyces sp. NBC_01565]
MPARSKDTMTLRRFAAEHIKAHARLAVVRPNAACSCQAAQCVFHETNVQCGGPTLLVLVHNPAVGQVWTLAEVCQVCASQIPHISILARAQGPARSGAAPANAAAPTAARPAVPGGFSSPQTAPEEPVGRRRPRRSGPRRAA